MFQEYTGWTVYIQIENGKIMKYYTHNWQVLTSLGGADNQMVWQ